MLHNKTCFQTNASFCACFGSKGDPKYCAASLGSRLDAVACLCRVYAQLIVCHMATADLAWQWLLNPVEPRLRLLVSAYVDLYT